MHEMSIAINIIRILREKMEALYGSYYPVKKVRVLVGKISTVVPSSLDFCFEAATQGTEMEGAKMEIVEIPIKVHCNDCGEDMILDEPFFFCRKCESFDLELLSGRELNVDTFEVDDSGMKEEGKIHHRDTEGTEGELKEQEKSV